MAYHRRSTVSYIVPPHIIEAIARHADPQHRQRAQSVFSRDQMFRAARRMRPHGRGMSRTYHPEAVPGGQMRRTVFDAHHKTHLPGTVVRREDGHEAKDTSVNEAYDGLGATYRLYWEQYQRASIDNKGMPLKAAIHYDTDYDNAFWDGTYMVFGDGDGEFFHRFTVSIDIIGHELTHGVTEHEAGLEYNGQSGALNESLSDVFGSLIKQYALGQEATEADWLIGAGLFTSRIQGVALRSLKDPGTAYDDPVLGKDPQPKHMRDYVETESDEGGVHLNSGIPNHAFYQAAIALGGHAWEKAGTIWYRTLRDPELKPDSDFAAFAARTLTNAERLYGVTSEEYGAVQAAWELVGVSPSPPNR